MRVNVVAPFALVGQARDGSVEVPEGTRVRDLFRLAIRAPVYSRFLPVTVNGERARGAQLLRPDDVVVFVMLLAGG